MIPKRLAAIAFRWSFAAGFALWVCPPDLKAQDAAGTAINGVYNGSYTCAQGPRTLKLSLQASGNGSLVGVFTFYLPPASHTRAFSYSLSGTLDAASGKFKLNPVKWETPPPAGYAMVGMDGVFDPGTGQVAGKIAQGGCGAFQATRDQGESAASASALAPQQAGGAAQTGPRTAVPAAQSPATSITGVYNGTYDCASGMVTLKLSLIGAPDGSLTGLFMIDPPPEVGYRFTYRLNGRYAWASHQFVLTPVAGGIPAPPGFAMGQLNGTYYSGSPHISGRAVSKFCNAFNGTRDKTESPTSATMAAEWEKAANQQIVTQPTETESVVASRAAAVRAATPPRAAAKGLVRKSQAYWGGYRTDMIRQAFDGGFGYDVDSDTQFRILFTSYVEMFAKNCRAYLPAQHEAVTVTRVTRKTDRYGNVVSQQEGQSVTVEVDSRFAPSYREYFKSLTSSEQGLAAALGSMSGRASPSSYFDPGFDMDKFFATETCQSAAVRQLGENLLRGATGKLSLQEVGATIAGAAAETDKPLPPGRFARFVDGCNAFLRDPATARHSGAHAGAWCKCLSEQYRHLMTPDEEYYYANDFEHRFWNEIAQPRGQSTDPAWPRLHPAIDRCAR